MQSLGLNQLVVDQHLLSVEDGLTQLAVHRPAPMAAHQVNGPREIVAAKTKLIDKLAELERAARAAPSLVANAAGLMQLPSGDWIEPTTMPKKVA